MPMTFSEKLLLHNLVSSARTYESIAEEAAKDDSRYIQGKADAYKSIASDLRLMGMNSFSPQAYRAALKKLNNNENRLNET